MKRITIPSMFLVGLATAGLTLTPACTGKRRTEEAASEAGSGGKLASLDDVDDSLNDKVEGERVRVLYDPDKDPHKGAAEPLVTIVEFSDFQCPYCSRLAKTLDEVLAAYPNDVRLVFKQFPLPMHKDAALGAEAALAAGEQGKYWEMHDKLFANQRAMSRADIEKYAQEIGLDMAKFKKALDDGTYKKKVQEDMNQGKSLGVRSTPTFFVNGKMQRGALGADAIKKLVEDEIKQAKKLLDAGAKRNEIYARIMKAAKAEAPKPEPQQRPGQPNPADNYAVPTGEDRPTWGKDTALVTIIEFSDFQCPFCNRVTGTLEQIKQNYGNDVRIVYRQLPLPFHKQAKPAAKAALAAHRQGKFWEMHDKLFANQKALTEENFKKWAQEIGLDVAKFEKDMKDPALDKIIEEDMKTANQWGARGTPAFFINGRFLSGAQPYPRFEALIKEELEKAKKFAAAHPDLKGDALYDEMAKGWEKELKQPPIADHKRREVSTEGLPAKGNTKDPKVVIVECSDFDCPFCKRATSTVDQILKEYGDKVAFYFRQYPLPMHKNAMPAHKAALAAHEQGKFWEMHDKLFANQKARSVEELTKMAEEVGLDVDKWKKSFEDPKLEEKIKADMAECSKMGVRGAPGFLINGRLLTGARPYPQFKQVLEEELAGGFEKKAKDDKKGS
ncbi:MAG: thioredoxin [Deltaproteobacteria bacterium]|nr:MAG: thioredoxin [Deltaproteobacteria bacterium]